MVRPSNRVDLLRLSEVGVGVEVGFLRLKANLLHDIPSRGHLVGEVSVTLVEGSLVLEPLMNKLVVNHVSLSVVASLALVLSLWTLNLSLRVEAVMGLPLFLKCTSRHRLRYVFGSLHLEVLTLGILALLVVFNVVVRLVLVLELAFVVVFEIGVHSVLVSDVLSAHGLARVHAVKLALRAVTLLSHAVGF